MLKFGSIRSEVGGRSRKFDKLSYNGANDGILFPALCFLVFVQLTGLEHVGLSSILTVQKICMPIVLVCMIIAHARDSMRGHAQKYDLVFVLIVSICFILGALTLVSDGSIQLFIQKVCYILAPWYFIAVFGFANPRRLFRALRTAFIVICIANFLGVVLTHSQGGFDPALGTYWLFGQRTYMRNLLFPALFFSVAHDRMTGVRLSFATVFILISNPLMLLAVNSMTSLMISLVLDLFVIASLFGLKIPNILREIFAIQIILDVCLVFARKFSFLNDFIVNLLRRDLTLSGRTHIWDLVMEKIPESPVIGTGLHDIADNGLELTATKNLSNAHNAVLDITYKGGIVSLALWIVLVIRCCLPLFRRNDKWLSFMLGLFLGAFLLEGVVGDIWYPQFFLLLYLAAYLDKWANMFERDTRESGVA